MSEKFSSVVPTSDETGPDEDKAASLVQFTTAIYFVEESEGDLA